MDEMDEDDDSEVSSNNLGTEDTINTSEEEGICQRNS